MKFLTQEWTEALTKGLATDDGMTKTLKGQSLKLIWLALDCPGGVDMFMEVSCNKGEWQPPKTEQIPAPSDLRTVPFDSQWLARISGKYEDMSKIAKGEASPFEVLNSKAYKIEGDIMKIMPMAGMLSTAFKIGGSLTTEY